MKRRMLTAIALLLCATPVSRAAAQRSHIGFHGGYNFDIDEALIGAQVHLPLTRSIELYPSFDYYFVSGGTLLGLNGDVLFRSPGAPLYLGGGVNVLRAKPSGGSSSSDTGFDLFLGFETRYGRTHPYIEARELFHDNTAFQVMAGINITLY
jgi:opacity protein-like surface antigen